jgi:hypothetical protein
MDNWMLARVYGDDSTIHRTFQRWVEINMFEMIWISLVYENEELGNIDWRWQAAKYRVLAQHENLSGNIEISA